jgi:hypothetical protein
MKWLCALLAMFGAMAVLADEKPKATALTAKEIANGWILLFDGETQFGWTIDGDAKVEDGKLILGGAKKTTARVTTEFESYSLDLIIPYCDPDVEYSYGGGQVVGSGDTTAKGIQFANTHRASPFSANIPAKSKLVISELRLRPNSMAPLFDGKDLTGWKQFTENPKQAKSKFTVTPDGRLNVKDGPGDLQTEKQFADFVLQVECISNGKHLNSGIFFRALPGQYQQGYEAQIHNGYKDGDRSKPMDYGTGAIYRRQPARKVVSNDHEWFTMTVVAHGNHIATWVNGYQVVDFIDTRPANDNARNGSKTAAGAISIQGHDPTTDLSFRNIRIAELPKEK